MPSPHVTRAVGSTTAAGTAQPLTCGRPRQTGRRSAISGIGSVSAGFVGTSSPAEADRGNRRSQRCCGSVRSPGGSVPTIVAALVGEWRIRAHQVCDAPVTGALRGHPPQRGCAGDFSAGQGEGLPHIQCRAAPPHFLWLRARDRMTGASSSLLLGAALVCDAAGLSPANLPARTTGQTPCMSDIQTLYTA